MFRALLRDWLHRLAHLTRAAADPWPGREWINGIRIRILRYLITRYGEQLEQASPADADRSFPDEPVPPVTYCIVDDPQDHPPRRAPSLGARLRHIRDINATPPPTLWRLVVRWWRTRHWRNSDAHA